MKKLNLKKKDTGRPPMKSGVAKAKVFSVSFRQSDLDELAEVLNGLKSEFGAKVSRNELVRRATLAHVRFLRAAQDGKAADYRKILEGID